MCTTKYQIVQQSKKSPKFVNKITTKYKIVQFGTNLPKALWYNAEVSEIVEVYMILKSDNVIVEIVVDKTYTIGSVDNRHYDVVLNPANYSRSDFTKTLAIHIDMFSKQFSIALIGFGLISDEDCAILDNNTLTVLLNQEIVQINIVDGAIIRHVKLDSFGCNFAIYKVDNGYILYGEMAITMLDFDFVEKWTFCGLDIFVSATGKQSFEMKENAICLYDFVDNYYEIDYEGNRIKWQSRINGLA